MARKKVVEEIRKRGDLPIQEAPKPQPDSVITGAGVLSRADAMKRNLEFAQTSGFIPSETQPKKEINLPSISELEEKEKFNQGFEIMQQRKLGLQAIGKGGVETRGEMITAQGQTALGLGKEIFSTGAQVIDALTSVFRKGGKTVRTQQAEEAFTASSAIIAKDIEMIKTGDKNYIDTLADLERAVQAMNRFEASAHGIGKINLRYWIDAGKQIETDIINQRVILEQYRTEIINAAQKQQIMQQQAELQQRRAAIISAGQASK